jgi:hypothetical protein
VATREGDAEAGRAEERTERAEAALQLALAERNRLWEELQRRTAQERELEHLRRRLAEIEGSAWWRAGAPLRLLRRALADPVLAVEVLLARLRALRGR